MSVDTMSVEKTNPVKQILPDHIICSLSGFNSLIKGKEGFILCNKNDVYIGRSVYKYGEFSDHEVKLFEKLCQPGDVIVDAGANIGTHTLAFSRLVGPKGKVYAYEPQKIVFQTLTANIALNSITNVETKNLALGESEGYVYIPEINYEQTSNFGGIEVNKFNQGAKIEKVTLDSLVDITRLDFIKIDVEGMEHDVITGAKRLIEKFKPILYVENYRFDKSKQLIELIMSFGYRIFWHGPPLYNENNYTGDKENIFSNIISVNMLCIHSSVNININLQENIDPNYHPMKRTGTSSY